jgi:hypothetical protein
MINEGATVGGIRIGRGNGCSLEKFATVPLCPPWTSPGIGTVLAKARFGHVILRVINGNDFSVTQRVLSRQFSEDGRHISIYV